MKQSKRIISAILILFMIVGQLSNVFAATIGETKDLVSLGECGRHLKYRNSQGVDTVIITHYIVYNEGGKQYPAYCLDVNLPGVDDEDSYGVVVGDMDQIANNQMVWRVLLNGFPYKTPEEMGLPDAQSAFAVTKQAIYSVLDGRDTNRYSGVDALGNTMANKVRELANIGRNGTQTYQDPVINVNAISEAGVDSIDSKYVSQTFNVNSDVNMKDINVILNTTSIPEGTKVTDMNNNEKTTFNKGESFKVLVPRENIKSDITVQFTLSGQCETYPILFGKAPNASVQNYVLTTDPFVTSVTTGEMKYKPSFDVEIDKVSNGDSKITGEDKGSGLAGATFKIMVDGEEAERILKTDENGKIYIEGLPLNTKITVTEVEAPDYYLMGKNTTFIIEGKYDGDDKKVTVENTPVDIEVNVDKSADKEEAQGKEMVEYTIDNIKNLSNVKLDNFTLTDYLPKEVRIQSLNTGTYNEDLKYSVTYNTNKRTDIEIAKDLSTTKNNTIDFTKEKLEKGEYITSYSLHFGTVKIGFSNDAQMKVKTKVITGLEDKSTFVNDVKVVGHYLEAQAEDEDDVPVKVYENILKVKKVSKEYNQYTDLPAGTKINATFDILDENKNYVETVKTKDGEFEYKYLETGKQYYLKEISVDDYYVISKDLIPFKFEENGQVVELTVENDNVDLIVDVEKEGPTEAEPGEVITYDFNKIGNFSNIDVDDFVWGDKLPRQVTAQKLETGTWNEELTYKVQYITNKTTNWKDAGEFSTTQNNTVDFTTLGLEDGEYVTEYRLCFGHVKSGFTQVEAPKLTAKVNEDVQNGKIFVNDTYVTATYKDTDLKDEDDAHTVVYKKTPVTPEKELPKTGF